MHARERGTGRGTRVLAFRELMGCFVRVQIPFGDALIDVWGCSSRENIVKAEGLARDLILSFELLGLWQSILSVEFGALGRQCAEAFTLEQVVC